MKDQASLLFRISLWFLALLRPLYQWTRRQWPKYFEGRTQPPVPLDTSRMLSQFNFFHGWCFGKGFEKIHFDEAELKNLEEAHRKGPVVLLMRNWGQVEYNYFNYLFLKKKFPLVAHNNMVKMGHWMPGKTLSAIRFQKIDRFMMEGHWPFNSQLFSLTNCLKANKPVLYCLDLPAQTPWLDPNFQEQGAIFSELLKVQADLQQPLQLVPLHFIYDKHPGKERKSIADILLGEREQPGYTRKIALFLRNFKKRAVAKIGSPLDMREILAGYGPGQPREFVAKDLVRKVQRVFEQETRQVTGPKLKTRKNLLAEVLEDPQLQERLTQLAQGEKISRKTAEKKVSRYLKEIASDINFTVIQLWEYFLDWLFNTLYEGLVVDQKGIAKIKKVAKDMPLILVPSHKSHMDYIVLSYVFYQNELSLPHVCAGINLNFWPLGSLFRRSGGYFIRRTIGGNRLYALALKGYVTQLMRDGYFQEFFIEGTRSRSGKLFPPRTGLLKMLVESFVENDLPDLYFVPIAISYERILEQKAYLEEIKGGKKAKERWTDLFRLPKFLKRRYGKVYVEFSDPISLKVRMQNQRANFKQDPERVWPLVQNLAQEISRDITRVSPLLPSPLVASVLLAHIHPAMTAKEIFQQSEELMKVARALAPRFSESLDKNTRYAIQVALEMFTKDGLLKVHEGLEEKFYTLSEESRIPLDYFKNKGLHVFIRCSLLQLCHHRDWQGSTWNADSALAATEQLLSREFFLSPEKAALPPQGLPLWMYRLALPILESYWLTLDALKRIPVTKMDQRPLVQKILETGQLLKHRGTLRFPESLSRFNIQNALQKFMETGILKNHEKEMGSKGRNIFSLGSDAEQRVETEKLLGILLER